MPEVAAGGYARCILSVRSGLVAVVTSVTLAFATPAFGSTPEPSSTESPATVWPTLRNPLELTHGRLALQPWDVYGGTLATALPNGGATQTILSRNAKILIIAGAIVVGLLLFVGIYYGTRPCCGPP